MSETADAKGLPLRQAIIRYQFPRPDEPEGMTAAELVQRYCDIAVGFDVPFRFQFVPRANLFNIVNKAHLKDALAVAEADPEDETAEGIPLLGSFYIGDDVPSMGIFRRKAHSLMSCTQRCKRFTRC